MHVGRAGRQVPTDPGIPRGKLWLCGREPAAAARQLDGRSAPRVEEFERLADPLRDLSSCRAVFAQM